MRRAAWIGLLLLLSGCGIKSYSVTTMRSYAVEIPVPRRPVLDTLTENEKGEVKKLTPELQKKIQGNVGKLHLYSEKLNVGVEEYNSWAKRNNAKLDKEIGYKQEEDK